MHTTRDQHKRPTPPSPQLPRTQTAVKRKHHHARQSSPARSNISGILYQIIWVIENAIQNSPKRKNI